MPVMMEHRGVERTTVSSAGFVILTLAHPERRRMQQMAGMARSQSNAFFIVAASYKI